MDAKSKEQIYDEQINPLMTRIIEICRENNIPLLAAFQLATSEEDKDGEFLCTTAHLEENSETLSSAREILLGRKSIGGAALAISVISSN